MFKIYQEESGHQIYVRCQMFSWRARAVSRMDSYIILITKLLKDIVAKETEDASTVKIFPKWVHARLLSANVHKHFHLCVHFYFVCISIVIHTTGLSWGAQNASKIDSTIKQICRHPHFIGFPVVDFRVGGDFPRVPRLISSLSTLSMPD